MFAREIFIERPGAVAVMALFLLSGRVLGHHSISPYDTQALQELEKTNPELGAFNGCIDSNLGFDPDNAGGCAGPCV